MSNAYRPQRLRYLAIFTREYVEGRPHTRAVYRDPDSKRRFFVMDSCVTEDRGPETMMFRSNDHGEPNSWNDFGYVPRLCSTQEEFDAAVSELGFEVVS